jgi:2,3-bisphosphoglycerate-independent phosphoglycerate mutase
MSDKRVILIILDGWGHGPKPEVSAIAQANTPFVDSLYQKYPNSELVTFGEQVGLPEGQMGNSEVGHMNIGAGRVVYQELARINKAVKEDQLRHNEVLKKALKTAKDKGVSLHLMGLVSDGGVHSHINHLKALCGICEAEGLEDVFIHAFLDGRDTAPHGGIGYLKELLEYNKDKSAKLASVIGRYYAMDRDKRWERVKLAYDVMVKGEGAATTDVLQSLQDSYDDGVTDEFVKPIFCGGEKGKIKDGDVLLCFNFRTDRPREISIVLTQEDMPDFDMKKLDLEYFTMTNYDETYKNIEVLFEKDNLTNTLGEILSRNHKTQVRIAETEKYPHVTFFFSGGREKEFEGERRLLVPSPKVATYDLQPEMSAQGITDSIVADIESNQPDFICLNYANTDMVGHTGVFSAAVKAAETVDGCLEKLLTTALAHDYEAIVIADHGNSDYMVNDDGSPHTAHTMNLVPFVLVSNNPDKYTVKDGKLADMAPSILTLMGVDIPEEMDGEILVAVK